MRIFVTGASGWIGSAVVPELLSAGHQVVGLARSDASAAILSTAGADVQRGSLDDLDMLQSAAAASDGVIHLAFKHDLAFSGAMQSAADADLAAIEAFGRALAGSDKPLVIASGVFGLTAAGQVATEKDTASMAGGPRVVSAETTLALAAQGVRSSVVRLSPTVHGEGDQGFVHAIIGIARQSGVSGYIGNGNNHWPAVHVRDAARLFRLAVEKAPAGSVLHGVAEQGVRIKDVAEVIGRHLNLPVQPIPAEHFGWLGGFIGADSQASNRLTRELVDWQPTHAGLIADLDEGHYFQK
ncbi:SDR family oxidoreductase [Deinococcus sp. UYEF24]